MDYLQIAKDYAMEKWRFDIVLPAGEEDGWHYFSCNRENRPQYSNMPVAIRVGVNGKVEEILSSALSLEIDDYAHQILLSKS